MPNFSASSTNYDSVPPTAVENRYEAVTTPLDGKNNCKLNIFKNHYESDKIFKNNIVLKYR